VHVGPSLNRYNGSAGECPEAQLFYGLSQHRRVFIDREQLNINLCKDCAFVKERLAGSDTGLPDMRIKSFILLQEHDLPQRSMIY
jgi:hypothetical protein